MKPIQLTAPVEIEVDEIAKALSSDELGSLISILANGLAEGDYHNRRRIAGEMAQGLSENATRMLGEVVANAYHNSKIWATKESR